MLNCGRSTGWIFCGLLLLALPEPLFAASPPPLIQYQGVLRGAADEPLSGTYDMEFSFFDTETGGLAILVDTHDAAGGGAVAVAGGLFSVQLGGGTLTDGPGPGNYFSFSSLFMDFGSIYLEVKVGTETLAPRTRIVASPYALSATSAETARYLNGQASTFYLDTSANWQLKFGALSLQTDDTNHPAFQATHTAGLGIAAGHFTTSGFTGRATLAEADRGITAYGSEYGGYFESPGWGARTWLARDSTAIWSEAPTNPGACAGRFFGAFDGSSHTARLGCNGGTGVDGYGYPGGHFLSNWGWTGEAFIGYGDEGMHGYGTFLGGYFADTDSLGWVRTGYSTYKVQGNGSVSFVQNHPYDKDKVIVYAAPEGDEVAVYTRGTARLVNGEARVKLGATFALVANPDVGLSANVTPIGDPIPLAVVEKSTSELVVRGPASSEVEFDYILWGLRIGFESQSIVQPKTAAAPVPAMTDHEATYAADPSLRDFSAFERFKAMHAERDPQVALDLTRSNRLLEAVGVYDPGREDAARMIEELRQPLSVRRRESPSPAPAADDLTAATTGASPKREAQEITEPSIASVSRRHPWREQLPASGVIEAGEVVVLDPLVTGAVKRCDTAADRNLVGVAIAPDVDGKVEVVVTTILEVLVDAGFGAIAAGDLLTTSVTPGAAMRASVAAPGTILGKALEPLESGIATIRVLLMPR